MITNNIRMSYFSLPKSFIVTVLLTLACLPARGQHIEAGLMTGPMKTDVQTFMAQPLDADGDFQFTNLAFFQRYHEAEDQTFDEVGIQSSVFWNFVRGLSIGPGLYYNSAAGLMSRIILQAAFTAGPLMIIANPVAYHHEDGYAGGELFAQVTYSRPAPDRWSLFARLNVLTTWDRLEDHGRSFLQLRVGPRLPKGLRFGLAADLDWYGPHTVSRESVGVFVLQGF